MWLRRLDAAFADQPATDTSRLFRLLCDANGSSCAGRVLLRGRGFLAEVAFRSICRWKFRRGHVPADTVPVAFFPPGPRHAFVIP